MTTYFLCRRGHAIGQAVMDVILTKHPAGDWVTGQVQANFGTVSDEEFERLRRHPDAVIIEDRYKPGSEVAVVLPPREDWPEEFADFAFLHPDPDDVDDIEEGSAEPIAVIEPSSRPTQTIRPIGQVRQGSRVGKLVVQPGGLRVVSFSRDRDECCLWSWDSVAIEEVARYGTHRPADARYILRSAEREIPWITVGCIGDVAFHPDGRTMALAGIGRPLELVDIRDGAPIRPLAAASGPTRFSGVPHDDLEVSADQRGFSSTLFSPSGRLIAADRSMEERTEIIDVATGRSVGSLRRVGRLVAHPDGERFLSIGGYDADTVSLYRFIDESGREESGDFLVPQSIRNRKNGEERSWLDPHIVGVFGARLSPSGDTLVLLGIAWSHEKWNLCVYEFPSFRLRYLIDLADDRNDVESSREDGYWRGSVDPSFDPTGRVLYVPTLHGDIVAIDAQTGNELTRWRAHEGRVTTAAPRDLPVLVSGGADGMIRIWDVSRVQSQVGQAFSPTLPPQ